MPLSGSRCYVAFACAIFVCCAGVSTSVVASPRSQQLIDDGVADLQQQNWRDALAKFLAASVADPGDHEAQFFQAVALNRIGNHAPALSQIERAREGGYANPDMDFEYGWALLGTGRYQDAIDAFQRYDAEGQQIGKTQELIGRAYIALGDDAAADRAFDTALARDSSLAPSVEFFRAGQAAARGEPAESRAILDTVAATQRTTRVGRAVSGHLEMLREMESADRGKRWRVVGSLAFGHNDNVITLGEHQPLPQDISTESAVFGQANLFAAYDLIRDPDQTLTAGYAFSTDRYSDLSTQNSASHVLTADYSRRLAPRLAGLVQAFGGDDHSDGERARRYVGARIATFWQFGEHLSLEPAISHTSQRYNSDPTLAPADDRDGHVNTAGATVRFRIPYIDADAFVGASVSKTDTEGDNFENNATTMIVGVSRDLFYGITGGILASRTDTQYANPDPRATVPFSERRHDKTQQLRFNLTRPLDERVTAYGRYLVTHNQSNIASFQYRQRVWMTGLTVTY